MEYKIAKPVEGRRVRNPADKAPIPVEGILVKVDSFWLRRQKDGDVTLTEAPKVEKEKPKKD